MKPLNFSVEKNFLKNRLEKIPRYVSKFEKEALLESDEESLIKMFDIICPNSIKPINEIEAGAFILKSREISVSDVIEGLSECSCGAINDFSIEIESLFNFDIKTDLPIGLFTEVEEIINKTDADNLSLKEYNKIQDELVENNKKILSVELESSCRRCGNVLAVVINPVNYISKSSISGIYDEYLSLSFYSNMTKQDIDESYPFEREIFLGLLKKKLEQTPQAQLK